MEVADQSKTVLASLLAFLDRHKDSLHPVAELIQERAQEVEANAALCPTAALCALAAGAGP